MDGNLNILGIDIGSVSISAAEVNPGKEIIQVAYEFHHGNIDKRLSNLLETYFDLTRIGWIASTSSTPSILKANKQYDNCLSVMTASRYFHPQIGAILVVGGEKFGLIRFDTNGDYLNFKTNTSCAAGTGSFLDQQAKRLNLSGIEALSTLALNNQGTIPKIASRCAVFAKTDLVHAQQEGYTLEEICDGLCYGLSKNIVDTVFQGEKPNGPVIFTGGVSKNLAVASHIQALVGQQVVTTKTAAYGAMGAAFLLAEELHAMERLQIETVSDALIQTVREKTYAYDPLEISLSKIPDFSNHETSLHTSEHTELNDPVEIDIYDPQMQSRKCLAYLGVDIGSTSTKAVLLDEKKTVLAGFYTRTAGRPVKAIQKLFEAMDDVARRKRIELRIIGAGTTGAGRKFIGKIINADVVVDEISAHARAACELCPAVDTIIEIGGQDSKFTTLKDGAVTFSVMNHVCAAGTGSFIEEQAQKLGCPLCDYSKRAMFQQAPISSDRCTVFMERDINRYIAEGFSVEEVLASVLHSIRENYLTKVAVENRIGETICFQGATAKNQALVAAFEQRLRKPIHISRYCHLTGALGTALMLADEGVKKTGFRGIEIYKAHIPVKTETCDLCTNHCKLTLADVAGETVAYGFLCGRDYVTKKFVDNNQSGFDLLKVRQNVFADSPPGNYREKLTVGIPAALALVEDLPLWKRFFHELSIRAITSERMEGAIAKGKHLTGAEFCAPMTALHGHVKYLLEKSDYIFLPFYLEKKSTEKDLRQQYCYYTQFSPALVSVIGGFRNKQKFLMPITGHISTSFHTKIQLYTALKSIPGLQVSFFDISAAYDAALDFKNACDAKLKEIYTDRIQTINGFHIVLLGRPYTALCASMNKGIPNIFASLGVQTYFQDMLPYGKKDIQKILPMLRELPWHYATKILEAAEVIARTKGAYPVFITSFKCTPDSFVIDYVKNLMESHGKPYLILQLDDHDSKVGYETRIEAAIRSFKNHFLTAWPKKPAKYAVSLIPEKKTRLRDKTLILPNWDHISQRLIVAGLRREGVDARLLEERQTSIQKSLRNNTGQCIPLNIIAQEFIDYVETHDLDPAKTVLWMVDSSLACNLSMFPHHIKRLLNTSGKGMEKAGIYLGNMSFMDISIRLPFDTYFAYMFGGLIRKTGCRIRPYEKIKGKTDETIEKSVEILMDAFSENRSRENAVEEVVSLFQGIETRYEPRPRVAIFGDLYVRDNAVMNQDLIHFIENNGGEVITTPYSSYVKMVASQYLRKWFSEGRYMSVLTSKVYMTTLTQMEKMYYKYFERILREPEPEYNDSQEKILSAYNIRMENTGESMDNILKIFYIKKYYPDVSLFVQTNPAFCCPSLVTEAMAGQIEKITGVPVVSITYDGTAGNKNDAIIPYLKYPKRIRYETDALKAFSRNA